MGVFDYFKSKWKFSNVIGLRIFVVLFLSILSILIFLLSVSTGLWDEIAKLGVQCKTGNREACAKLVDIAQNDNDSFRRERAVQNLTDQTVLTDIAKNEKNSDVRLAAVGNSHFADQVLLADIAKDDKDYRVRRTALEKLEKLKQK